MSKKIGLVLALLCSAHLLAATVEVGTCSHYTQYATIQAAVTAVSAGSTVLVCPGTYPEQVTIAKPLTLAGALSPASSGATIVPPAGGVIPNTTSLSSGSPIAAQILVQNTREVSIINLTVNGSNNGITGCAPNLVGILYQNASGLISGSAIVNQALTTNLNGCQNGLGIFVQSGSSGMSNVVISSNLVEGYQKNGITGNEAGTRVIVTGNSVTGQGPTTGAAENGIQIGFGAKGTVSMNSVIDNVWAPDTFSDPGDAATGILVYASSGVEISGNHVGNNQFGIAVYTDPTYGSGDESSILLNQISSTHIFDGIDVCSNSNVVRDNRISGSDESAIHLDSSCGSTGSSNLVRGNVINSACAGILEGTGTTGDAVLLNLFYNVGATVMNADQCTGLIEAPLLLAAPSTTGTPGGGKFKPARP